MPRQSSQWSTEIYNTVYDDHRLRVLELSDIVGIAKSTVFYLNKNNKICTRESCVQNGCHICSYSIKINVVKIFWLNIQRSSTPETKGRTGSKEGKDRFIYRQGYGVGFLECTSDNFHWLFWKRKSTNGEYYANFLQCLSENQAKTAAFSWEKSIVSSRQCISPQIHYCNGHN